jgi:hypothetical protein
MEHKRAVVLCLIGGALMLIGSVFGSVGFIGKLLSLTTNYVDPGIEAVIQGTLTVFGYIAAGGGISVIVGAFIAGFGPDRIGRFVSGIGVGAGLLSLIILIITSLIGGASVNDLPTIFLTTFNNGYGLAGVLISIIGIMRLKD